MATEIQPLLPEDVPQWVTVHERAFTQTGELWRLTFQTPIGAEGKEIWRQNRLNSLLNDPTTRHIKAVEEDGTIVGVAKWNVFPTARTEADLDAEAASVPRMAPEMHVEALTAFYKALFKSRRETMGTRPYVMLASLCVDPEAQGKGVGKALVGWGTKIADELGLECYLESTSMGKGLYTRMGFLPVAELDYRMRDYGIDGEDPHAIMIRQPKKE